MSISFARSSIAAVCPQLESLRIDAIERSGTMIIKGGVMKIISIDPGGVTGWACFTIPLAPTGDPVWGGPVKQNFSSYGQLTTPEHHDELDSLLDKTNPDLIVCERFEKRNNDFSLLISCEYIGVVKRYGQYSGTEVIMQGSSQALVWCDNKKMSVLDLLIKPYTANKDANAARKHLLYFLIFGDKTPKIRQHLLEKLKGNL